MSHPQAVATAAAPPAVGPYSQAMMAGNLLFVSGQLPIDGAGSPLPEGIAQQTRQVLANLAAIARAADVPMERAVKLTVYLTDLAHFPVVNEIMAATLKPPYPARSTVQVAALPRGALLEIDAVLLKEGGHV
jgi:2-iminobutanoate/2-iminopropanoate deaminase